MLTANGPCASARPVLSSWSRFVCPSRVAVVRLTRRRAAAAAAAAPSRPDLSPGYTSAPELQLNNVSYATVKIPVFKSASNGVRPKAGMTVEHKVPQPDKATIQQIKAAAAARLSPYVQQRIAQIKADASRNANAGSGFSHPGGITSAAELAVMQARLAEGLQPQTKAKECLISGEGVPKKKYDITDSNSWAPPTDCKPSTYDGPYAMANIFTKYGGDNGKTLEAARKYTGPNANSGHVSFVELDAQMAYKMALAWWATGDESYAQKALAIIDAWASTNKSWGMLNENGPLEAGWGIAAIARALELLRHKAQPGLIDKEFKEWVWRGNPTKPDEGGPMVQMQNYIKANASMYKYNNWHSTICEAWMALAVLLDDAKLYTAAVSLFHTTVKSYIWRWGRDKDQLAASRLIGETSETRRDLAHMQFGLGGLLQAAEIAWQQDNHFEDLYSSSEYALAGAMEFHARIIRAGLAAGRSNLLPEGFELQGKDWFTAETQKKPTTSPANVKLNDWQFEISLQQWARQVGGKNEFPERWDAGQVLQGSAPGRCKFLPCGWEVGYNHYAGRLGLPMPETAALLQEVWPEWQEFHWGLGSLSHADTATPLWRAGLPGSKVAPA